MPSSPVTASAVPAPLGPSRTSVTLRAAPGRARTDLVRRDRLVRRLLGARDVSVVAVTAPAGYGKTVLLEEWAAQDPRPFVWLALGRGRLAQRRWSAALAHLASAPEQLDAGAVVVIDGVEGPLDGVASAHVAELAASKPPGTLLVVASRSADALRLGRLRVQRDVVEIGARDLAMTAGEAAALFERRGVRLSRPEATDLLTACRGWPVVLGLVADVLASDPAPATATDAVVAHPHVVEYVRDEILAQLPPQLARFVLRCSVLDVLEPEACAAVVAEPRVRERISELERSALPVTPLERTSLRLRLHPVARDVLAGELERLRPQELRDGHRRASAWFAQHGDLAPALRHALAAGDLQVAGTLLWRAAQTTAFARDQTVLVDGLRGLSPAQLEAHPGLSLAAAMQALAGLRVAAAEQHLAVAGAAARSAEDPSLRAGLAALTAATARDDLATLRARAQEAVALTDARQPVHALARLLGGVAAGLAGDRLGAGRALEDTARVAAASAPGIAALSDAQLALEALCHGEVDRGANLAERARARAEAVGARDRPILALVFAVSAFARAHRGRFAEARADADLAVDVVGDRDELPPWYGAQLTLALARASLRLSDVGAARPLLADARHVAARLPDAAALHAWVAAAEQQLRATGRSAFAPDEPLTPAELRVLTFLPTHRSFREIGACLHVSANTIKSQAHAVYRKLDASSRSAAVARAAALGLLDAACAASPASEDARLLAVLRASSPHPVQRSI